MVSVAIITYNHERFIASAIESAIEQVQVANMPMEIVISDDCSTDGTAAIVREYQSKHPSLIRANLRTVNVGVNRNFRETLESCKGEFIALLEGDDCWTDKQKLELQIAELRTHPDWSGCFHRVQFINADGSNRSELAPTDSCPPTIDERHLMRSGNIVPTPSLLFRRSALPKFEPDFDALRIGDFPLIVGLSRRGALGYIPKLMAAYRVHNQGTFSAIGIRRRAASVTETYDYVDRLTQHRYSRWVRGHKAHWSFLAAIDEGNNASARINALKTLVNAPVGVTSMAALVALAAPSQYHAVRAAFRKHD
jgi:glycosyltransferase involved in cell wall biosynthesis